MRAATESEQLRFIAEQEPTRRPRRQIDLPKFFERIKYNPTKWQRSVHRADEMFRVLACGVRSGKTKCAAGELMAAALEPIPGDHHYWCVGPTYALADKAFREVVRMSHEHLGKPFIDKYSESQRFIRYRNLAGGYSTITAKSTDNPVSLLGEGVSGMVIDEASRIRPTDWTEYLSQRLIDKNGWCLFISTPKRKGWYYQTWQRGREGNKKKDPAYQSWHLPSWANPYLNLARLKRERASIPELSWRQEYLAQFVEGAGSVFQKIYECATVEAWPKYDASRVYVAGLDLARVEDYTVLVIFDKVSRQIVFVDRFNRKPWDAIEDRVTRALQSWGHPVCYVDATGVGDPVAQNLRRAGVKVRPFKFTSDSKRQIVDNFATLLEQELVAIPSYELWPHACAELEEFEYAETKTGSGNLKMQAPDGGYDDVVMALCLAAWGMRPGRGLKIHSRRREE